MDDVGLHLEGDPGQISAESLHEALGDLLELLRETATVADVETQEWRITGLEAASAHVLMSAPEGLTIANYLRRGLDELRERPAIPEGWSRHMVKHVLDLGRRVGEGGTTGVSLDLGNRKTGRRSLGPVVVDHAKRALGSATAAYGSVRGRVDRWNEHTKREIGLTREDGSAVTARYGRALSERIVREAVGNEIEAWGTIRRNVMGQITSMTIEDFGVLEPTEPISIQSMVGVYRTDDAFTLEEWIESRHADG